LSSYLAIVAEWSTDMRADAQRNRGRLVSAARDSILEAGPEVALEVIARRAGVGIATLYRHFPERITLVRAVAADVLQRCTAKAGAALAEEPDAFAALRRFMHQALDLGVAVTNLVAADLEDEQSIECRDECASAIGRILDVAHQDGSLRTDAGFADIGIALVRFSRPIGSGFDPDLETAFAHRHLDIYIDGLQVGGGVPPLPGRGLALEDLRAMEDRHDA
jgi:AcrR family transcriptional regulator